MKQTLFSLAETQQPENEADGCSIMPYQINFTVMKKTALLTICLVLLHTGLSDGQKGRPEPAQNPVNAVNVACTPETEALASVWINGFLEENPGTEIRLLKADNAEGADIYIISGNSTAYEDKATSWKMVVGRDVIVPVISASDPYQARITEYGISPELFARLLSSSGGLTWGELLNDESRSTVTVLIPDDNTAALALSKFAGIEPGLITAGRLSPAGLSAAIKDQPGVIAFCRLADITDQSGQEFAPDIRVIPVDINNNAKSDYFEQFYSDYNSFSRGVYIGKYPKALCNNIYAVAAAVPPRGAPSDLVKYVLADGQRYLAGAGFTALARGEGLIRSEALAEDQSAVTAASERTPALRAWLWVLTVIAAVSLFAYAIYRFTRPGMIRTVAPEKSPSLAFNLKSLITPAGILFDKSHAWAFMEKDGMVKVGIDDFLQHVTGSVTRVRLKSPGERIRKGEHLLSVIQKGKQLDIQSPVSGTIAARNERVVTDSGLINSSPYNEGWIYSVEPDNWEKESRLMVMAGKYIEYLKEEFARIRDFLSVMPGVNDKMYAHVVLQDGGEFKDGLLEEFGPEVWAEFQMKFLDVPR